MLRTGIDAPIEIIMAEIPRLARVDRSSASSARCEAGCHLPRNTLTELLMLPAVTASMRLYLASLERFSGIGGEILTAAGSPALASKRSGRDSALNTARELEGFREDGLRGAGITPSRVS